MSEEESHLSTVTKSELHVHFHSGFEQISKPHHLIQCCSSILMINPHFTLSMEQILFLFKTFKCYFAKTEHSVTYLYPVLFSNRDID